MKSVQIWSFPWSLLSRIRTEYGKIRTRENTVFGHFSQYEHQIFQSLRFTYDKPFRRQPHKMVEHTQEIRQLLPTNCLSVFAHFVGLALKDVKIRFKSN